MGLQIDEDVAKLYGILAGDGCLSRHENHRIISITGHIDDDLRFFEEVLIPLLENLRGKTMKYRQREKYGKIEINFSDKDLFKALKSAGFPIGKKELLEIPDTIPKELYPEVISGYFATDGSVVLTDNNGILYPRIEIQGKSHEILQQSRDFLHDKGITGSVYEHTRTTNLGKYTIYRLQINGREKALMFRDIIGFLNPKHRDKFTDYVEAEVAQSVRALHGYPG